MKTSPTHYAPVVIFWYSERPLMDNTPPPPSEGGRAETASADGGGYEVNHGKCLPVPQNITELGNVIEVPGSYHYVIG